MLFWIGLITAIWFAWTGMIWTYWAALIIAYPIGIVSFILWRMIKDENRRRTKFIPIILSIGLMLSLGVLICLLIWD